MRARLYPSIELFGLHLFQNIHKHVANCLGLDIYKIYCNYCDFCHVVRSVRTIDAFSRSEFARALIFSLCRLPTSINSRRIYPTTNVLPVVKIAGLRGIKESELFLPLSSQRHSIHRILFRGRLERHHPRICPAPGRGKEPRVKNLAGRNWDPEEWKFKYLPNVSELLPSLHRW